jgi:hypothetical protein
MWNRPTQKQLAKLPPLYSTEGVELKEKIVRMHFFLGGSDWWAVEYSPEKELFFGFVCLGGDKQNAEWGYFSLPELVVQRFSGMEIDRDLYWTVRPVCKVAEIPDDKYHDRNLDSVL